MRLVSMEAMLSFFLRFRLRGTLFYRFSWTIFYKFIKVDLINTNPLQHSDFEVSMLTNDLKE